MADPLLPRPGVPIEVSENWNFIPSKDSTSSTEIILDSDNTILSDQQESVAQVVDIEYDPLTNTYKCLLNYPITKLNITYTVPREFPSSKEISDRRFIKIMEEENERSESGKD